MSGIGEFGNVTPVYDIPYERIDVMNEPFDIRTDPDEFDDGLVTVTLVMLQGTASGMGLRPDVKLQSLRVKEIRRRGMVDLWNRAHPRLKINRGDLIVKVNHVEGDWRRMLQECVTSDVLEFKVRKGASLPRATSGAGPPAISRATSGAVLPAISRATSGVVPPAIPHQCCVS